MLTILARCGYTGFTDIPALECHLVKIGQVQHLQTGPIQAVFIRKKNPPRLTIPDGGAPRITVFHSADLYTVTNPLKFCGQTIKVSLFLRGESETDASYGRKLFRISGDNRQNVSVFGWHGSYNG